MMMSSHANLKIARSGKIFNTFERFELFPEHIQAVNLQSGNGCLRQGELHLKRHDSISQPEFESYNSQFLH